MRLLNTIKTMIICTCLNINENGLMNADSVVLTTLTSVMGFMVVSSYLCTQKKNQNYESSRDKKNYNNR